jgi:subtilase family serine protease
MLYQSFRARATALVAAAMLLVPAAPVTVATAQHFIPAVGAHPQMRMIKPQTRAGDVFFGCQLRHVDDPSGGIACTDPDTVRKAYGFDKVIAGGTDGTGRTIVIVDAYQNPYMATDLAAFDFVWNLPDPVFSQIAPDGLTPFDLSSDNQVGWAGEIALDVQWAHAMAPGAAIKLVLAKSSDDTDINSALRYAVDHNLGDVISMSFGEGEACMSDANLAFQHATFQRAAKKSITLVAASGDQGAAQRTQGPDACDLGTSFFKSASTPASDPLVTGVGGTNLFAQDQSVGSAGYISERAWSDGFTDGCTTLDLGCSGGGFSTLFSRPDYQGGVPNTDKKHRGVPDVAYNAGVDGGVITHYGVANVLFGFSPDDLIFFVFGGTSAGAPQWAALVALADQAGHHRVGQINPSLYDVSHSAKQYAKAFHDITSGTNDFDSVSGFNAAPNWDAVTGLGTPKADYLVPFLAGG